MRLIVDSGNTGGQRLGHGKTDRQGGCFRCPRRQRGHFEKLRRSVWPSPRAMLFQICQCVSTIPGIRMATDMAQERGLRILGLSEIYGFNVWNDARAAEIAALIDIAEASDAETFSLIPSVDDRTTRPLRDVMHAILPMLEGRRALPLTVGFESSTLRRKAELAEAIAAVGGPRKFKMVHDTFLHTISGGTELFAEFTGVVHISESSRPSVVLDTSQDAYCGLVDADDRWGNIAQITGLLQSDYSGAFSLQRTEDALIRNPGPMDLKNSFQCAERAFL